MYISKQNLDNLQGHSFKGIECTGRTILSLPKIHQHGFCFVCGASLTSQILKASCFSPLRCPETKLLSPQLSCLVSFLNHQNHSVRPQAEGRMYTIYLIPITESYVQMLDVCLPVHPEIRGLFFRSIFHHTQH